MKEAAVTIIFYDAKVLLVKRRDVPVWVLPGGGIEDGERPEDAAVREAKEETGIDVSVVRKVGEWLATNKLASSAHVFECTPTHPPGELLPQKESKDVRFFSPDALPKNFFFLHRIWLEAALKNLPERIYLITELTYWNVIKIIISHPLLSFRYILSRIGLPLND